jgi:hypothetical protein
MGQIWYVAGFHFTMLRIMLLFGWARLIIRKDMVGIKFNEIDKALLLWVLANFVIYNLRELSADAFVNRLGFAYNTIGFYFFFRFLIRDHEDIILLVKALAILVVPLAACMILEKTTGRNIFSHFGGVGEFTVVRGERLRCQGPFRHPILAGSFGSVIVPLLVGLWFSGRAKALALVAGISATVVTVTSASSGPVLSYAAGIVALGAWRIRRNMRVIRWGILATVIVLHIVMKAPVWYLIGRTSAISGGTGWHRSELINQAITRIDEWWILGTSYTEHWMPYALRLYQGQADITNNYLRQGVDGGLLTMMLFIVVIALCFKQVGLTVKAWENIEHLPQYLPWALGASLFVHAVAFIAVSYFDQMQIYFFMLLAMIAALPKMRVGNDQIYSNRF